MISLIDKQIPLKFFAPYTVGILNDQKQPMPFSFGIALDTLNNMYVLPLIAKATSPTDMQTVEAYTVADMVCAVSGDSEKALMIQKWHDSLRYAYGNVKIMTDDFLQNEIANDMLKEYFVEDFNAYLSANGKESNITVEDLPKQVTTYTNMTTQQAEQIALTAVKQQLAN